MGWMAEFWRDVRAQSVAGQTEPRVVWSSFGGRPREVTVVWPPGERGMWRYDAVRGLGLLLAVAVVGVLSVGALRVADQTWFDGDLVDGDPLDFGDPSYGVLLLVAFLVTLWVAIAAAALVKLVLGVIRRHRAVTIEAIVVLRQRVAVRGDNDITYRDYLAVDDGTSTTLTAARVGHHIYDHFVAGDRVHVTRAPGDHRILRIEGVQDEHGQPIPPLGHRRQ